MLDPEQMKLQAEHISPVRVSTIVFGLREFLDTVRGVGGTIDAERLADRFSGAFIVTETDPEVFNPESASIPPELYRRYFPAAPLDETELRCERGLVRSTLAQLDKHGRFVYDSRDARLTYEALEQMLARSGVEVNFGQPAGNFVAGTLIGSFLRNRPDLEIAFVR